ncbi:carboxypeptidase regulatory-like domain-containing protein, partial [Kineosporia sp. A_224]|uniref:carboxypeptidase regulatory-like domain-containing protein n=1 Tax=Kineosporia sp. A_224 TaxID=1962180 RepID=UPI001E422E9E
GGRPWRRGGTASRWRRSLAPALVVATVASGATVAVGTLSEAAAVDTGTWGPVLDWGLQGKHMAALPTGKVLVWSTGANARVWDPSNGSFTDAPALFGDLHCAGNAQLADGRVVVLGGQNGGTHIGTKVTALFDPGTQTWTEGTPMTYERWYASVTALADGRLLSTSGDDAAGRRITTPEVYDPKTNAWTPLTGGVRSQGLYPHMYVLPNGKVFEAAPEANTAVLDLAGTGSWSPGPANKWSTNGYSESSVMYEPGKIMRAGGGDPAISRTAVVDMTVASPAWTETAPMTFARRRMNMVLLADGQVLAVGGTASGDSEASAVLPAEIWNPQTRTWSTLGPMTEARMYHSSAVLMLDGRVLTAGGEATGRLHAQIYTPPYLLKGPRPTISSAPAVAGYGTSLAVTTPDTASITSVALVRLGAATHAWDQNQRYVPLKFTPTPTGVTATAPANGNIAPPGNYMLVVKNSTGVPSVGKIVRIDSSAALTPGRAVGLVTSGGAPLAGVTVTAGSATATTGADGRYTLPGLTPGEQGLTFTRAGFATVTRTVLVAAGADVTTNVALVPPATLTGRVTDAASGAGLPDAVVSSSSGSTVTTAADGSYTIAGAPSGPLTLTVTSIGYETRTLDVTLPPNTTVTQNVGLTASATFVTGGVTDRVTGNPLVGATVTLGASTTTTDAIGRYRFDVPAGTYTVSATAAGYTTASAQAIVTTGTYAVVDLQLDLAGASDRIKSMTFENASLTDPSTGADRVSGTVTRETANPLAGTGSARFGGTSAYLEEAFTARDDLYVSGLLRLDTVPTTDTRVLQVLDGTTTVAALQVRATSGRLRLRNGSTTVGVESAPLTPGTTYRVGVHQRRGTGANAVLEAFVAPVGTEYGTPFARTATGTWTTAATALRFGTTTGNGASTLDDVLVDGATMPTAGTGTPPPPPPPR